MRTASELGALHVEKPTSVVAADRPGASVTTGAGLPDATAGSSSGAPARTSRACGTPDMAHDEALMFVNEIDANCRPLMPEPRSTSIRRSAVRHARRPAGEADVAGAGRMCRDGAGLVVDDVTGGEGDVDGRATTVLAGWVGPAGRDVSHAASASGAKTAGVSRSRYVIRRIS